MLAFSVAGQVAVERFIESPGRWRAGRRDRRVSGSRSRSSPTPSATRTRALGRAVHALGHEIQRLISTREPTPEQIEVGRRRVAERSSGPRAPAADTV